MRAPSLVRFCRLFLWGALAGSLAMSCVSEKQARKPADRSESRGGQIQEINLLAMPVALNLGAQPGPDGFVIKIYAGNSKRPKPFPIETGSIEVRMYDGVPGVTEPVTVRPRRVWTFSAAQLRPYELVTSIGAGYELALRWGDAKPTSDKISVVVHYTPPEGKTIISAPSIIAAR
jgi:hypothetical protein